MTDVEKVVILLGVAVLVIGVNMLVLYFMYFNQQKEINELQSISHVEGG